jgi:hypothetical protein
MRRGVYTANAFGKPNTTVPRCCALYDLPEIIISLTKRFAFDDDIRGHKEGNLDNHGTGEIVCIASMALEDFQRIARPV